MIVRIAGGYLNRSQAAATSKDAFANGGNAVRNGDGGKAATPQKGRVTDVGDAAADGNRGQVFAIVKGTVADGGDPLLDDHFSNGSTPRCNLIGIIPHFPISGNG